MNYVAIEPRKGKGNRRLCYSLTDFYREYTAECLRQYGAVEYIKRRIPRLVFLSILTMYLSELIKWIIIEEKTFRMPKRLGKFRVLKRDCVSGDIQETRIGFCKPTEKNKEKFAYYARNHFHGHFFVIKWRKLTNRGTMRFVGWYAFMITRTAKKFLSNHVFELSQDPMAKNYDSPPDKKNRQSVRNPLNLPPPCE